MWGIRAPQCHYGAPLATITNYLKNVTRIHSEKDLPLDRLYRPKRIMILFRFGVAFAILDCTYDQS